MQRYLMVMLAVGAAVIITGGVFSVYQMFRLVEADAKCRGLKHPKLWGVIAASGNNQSGLILYLINRKTYPIISMNDDERAFIERCKKKVGVGILFLAAGAIICVWGIVLI